MGFPHPDYLLSVLTAEQIAEWEAYDRVEPFGAEADNFRTGLICSTIANQYAKRRLTPMDFMPVESWIEKALAAETLEDRVHAIFGPMARKSRAKAGSPPVH